MKPKSFSWCSFTKDVNCKLLNKGFVETVSTNAIPLKSAVKGISTTLASGLNAIHFGSLANVECQSSLRLLSRPQQRGLT